MLDPERARCPVTAIVPNWNRQDLLERVLAALASQSVPCEEVLVVDNCSEDQSIRVAERAGARVIRLGRNAGFAAAVNRGVLESRTEWVAVVNNDVEPAEDWLERLWAAAQAPGVWFATGKILRAGGGEVLDGTFDALARSACAWRCGEGRRDSPLWSQRRTIRFAPLTAALLRREVFEKVGALDERFESYLEDVEFGLRCALAGFEGVYEPQATARHAASATLGAWHPRKVRLMARNQLLLVAKHYPRRWGWRYGWPVVVGQALWGLVALRRGRACAYLAGKWDGVRSFRNLRGRAEHPRFEEVLATSEWELLELQEAAGFDWYWRLYFTLT